MIPSPAYILVVLPLLLSGCVTYKAPFQEYVPPTKVDAAKHDQVVTVKQPFAVVWKRAVANLSARLFVIDNMNERSRLINVAYAFDRPEEFVDCGKIRQETLNLPDGLFPIEEYQVAKRVNITALQWEKLLEGGRHKAILNHVPNIRVRASVHFTPLGDTTRVTVAALYRFSARQYYTYPTGDRAVVPRWERHLRTMGQRFDTVTFKTGVMSGGVPQCISTGKFEKSILDAVR